LSAAATRTKASDARHGAHFSSRAHLVGRVYHRGEEIRESSESESESEARKILKRRLAETQTGRFIIDEEKVTFEELAKGRVTDYKLNGRRSLKTAALNNIKHLRAFFGFDRAIDISSDVGKAINS
jgi:hypothetical protein